MRDLMVRLASAPAPVKGIACMAGGGLLLTLNDAVAKWLTAEYPIGEFLFLRGLFIFIPIAIVTRWSGGFGALRVRDLRGQSLRALLTATSTYLFIFAIGIMPLADVIAIVFAGPLFLTALAPFLLSERVGWRRWSAVIAGFVGVLVMIRPTPETWRLVALVPLLVALLAAFRDITTRKLTFVDSSPATLLFTTVAVMLSGLATLPLGWKPVAPGDLALMALAGLLVGGAHFLMIESLRLGEAALVVPFRYANLIWATILGALIWRDFPDRWMIAGSVLVIASGLYILRRETRAYGARKGA